MGAAGHPFGMSPQPPAPRPRGATSLPPGPASTPSGPTVGSRSQAEFANFAAAGEKSAGWGRGRGERDGGPSLRRSLPALALNH